MRARQNGLFFTWPWWSGLADWSFESFKAWPGLEYCRMCHYSWRYCGHEDIVASIVFAAGGAVVSTAGKSEVQFPDCCGVQFVFCLSLHLLPVQRCADEVDWIVLRCECECERLLFVASLGDKWHATLSARQALMEKCSQVCTHHFVEECVKCRCRPGVCSSSRLISRDCRHAGIRLLQTQVYCDDQKEKAPVFPMASFQKCPLSLLLLALFNRLFTVGHSARVSWNFRRKVTI